MGAGGNKKKVARQGGLQAGGGGGASEGKKWSRKARCHAELGATEKHGQTLFDKKKKKTSGERE